MFSARFIPVVVVLSAGSTGCWLNLGHKQARVFVPPPVAPKAPPPAQPDIPNPAIVVVAMNLPPQYPAEIPVIPPPPAPVKRPAPPPVRATAPPPAPTPETPAPPKLGQIFTAEQLRDYNRNMDESLERVRRALAIVAGKNLNTEQLATAERIRTFQKQAEEAREQDLVTAVSLAKRADLLAQDLLNRVQ